MDVLFYSRWLMLVFVAGILAVTYLLSLRIFKKHEIALISIILTLTTAAFYSKSIEIRPDVAQSFFALLSIYYLFVYFDTRSLGSLLACAVSLAISYLFLQKTVSLIFVIGLFLIYDLITKRISLRHIILFCAAFLICILPYYVYLLLSGSFDQYFLANWLVNMYLPQHYPRLEALYDVAIRRNPVTVALFIIGTIIILFSGKRKRFALFSILFILTTIIVFKNLLLQYLMPLFPLMGIIAAYSVYRVSSYKPVRLILILAAISLPIIHMYDREYYKIHNITQKDQIDKIEYVLSITNEDDLVYDGNRFFNLFRDDIDYFWFSLGFNKCMDTYNMISSYHYNVYELIDSKKPRVISTHDIQRLDDRRIIEHYRMSDKYTDLLVRDN